MDVQKKLDDIVGAVKGAKSMPMSASCVINRAELLSMLEEVREALPGSLAQAREVIGDREQVVERARQEAGRIIEAARAERGSLISDTAVARQSQEESERILAQARQEADEIRAEADDYVDSKLANFEVVLNKTLGSVGRGREKLLGTGAGLTEQGYEDPDFTEAPERSHDPETLRRRADEYVDVKLGAFEAVLAKTLDAVGRGRQTLHGRMASDGLGEQPTDALTGEHTSDADYLAELAEPPTAPTQPPPYAPQQEQYGYPQHPEHPQHDPYAYQQQSQHQSQHQPYGHQQEQYGYAQQEQYGGQRDPYGYPQQGYAPAAAAATPEPSALDETSLFDTSMISMDQLRQYEQDRRQNP
ncbi:cell division initiation protein [Streptomyces apocyni]|uniref:cell division initiation protein n=1 Tax=Streptomyces apocyni TaxID=2654677 RepID=UPI0012EA7C96|nr:cell division initiation protein [Streptomyces apocyni]